MRPLLRVFTFSKAHRIEWTLVYSRRSSHCIAIWCCSHAALTVTMLLLSQAMRFKTIKYDSILWPWQWHYNIVASSLPSIDPAAETYIGIQEELPRASERRAAPVSLHKTSTIMTMTNETLEEDCFEKLAKLRAKVNNWQCEKERRDFIRLLYPLISNWEGQYPNLLAIFARGEIDAFLGESVLTSSDYHREVAPLLDFVIRSGYTDDDDDDDKEERRRYGNKKSSVYRVTPVHRARAKYYGTFNGQNLVRNLFRVYNCFEVNYRDAEGYTHLHVACEFGCEEIVELFLKLGQVSPDCLCRGGTGDGPLHLAMKRGRHAVARLLQRHGADVNLANAEGLTPLHIICKNYSDAKYAEKFFEIERELLRNNNNNDDDDEQDRSPPQPRLRIDARDNEGRTPLQWAVASLLPDMVDVLIDNGADLAGFVFPTESYLGERFKSRNKISYCFRLRLASDALACIERLEKRGYQLKRDDARTIMKFFDNHGLFEKTTTRREEEEEDEGTNWRNQKDFAEKSREIMMTPSLSLYDLVRLRPEEAAKRVTYEDYYKFARRTDLWDLPEAPRDACLVHLCETMSRRFFRSWATDPFIELMRNRLPLLCCDLIVDNLMNEDLWRICLATASEIT
ncbi:unnamed protein product [Trichogramma brassicae]|uniref:Uncharacterized protein n=1 Tax=Trichogramma brassicae TaxID=86971 RepID=A0A6H5IJY9_9HYME|nr:unnamed protein product [Trichogramma brassicae]